MNREDDFRALAAARPGWRFEIEPPFFPLGSRVFWIGPDNGKGESAERIDIPAPAAPLPEALAFVGRIAEAIGHAEDFSCGVEDGTAEVQFGERPVVGKEWPRPIIGTAPDLAWAAVRAAIAAKGGSHGHS